MNPPIAEATDARLQAALRGAHLPTLLMVLAQLTGDERWLGERCRPDRPRGWDDPDSGGLPDDVQEEIRAGALEAIRRWRDGEAEPLVPGDERLVEMASICVGQEVPADNARMVAEEIGLRDRDAVWAAVQHVPRPATGFRVVIAGAGFSGIGLAIKLERARIGYVVVEKNPRLGGTWLENVYPGCKVDSPSHLYQYSFEPRPDWPEYYSRRDEILGYLEYCAGKYGVTPNIRLETEVVAAAWDSERTRWSLELRGPGGAGETLDATVFVTSVGQLNRPQVPEIEGAATFTGRAMHTARWDPDVDVAGRRLVVIGNGASAMQLVPATAGVAEKVTVFQRSPQWAVPNPDLSRAVSPDTRWLLEHVPFYSGWYRFRQFWLWNDNIWPTLQIDPDWPHQDRSINERNEAHRKFFTKHIERALEGRPDLVEKCLPSYPPYGKRMLMDAGWFEAMARDDVELVTEPIARITPAGVVAAGGTEHPADVIAYATGFHVQKFLWPMEIRGRDGLSIREAWGDDDARAYLGVAAPGFPNMICLYGPNTNTGHGGSVLFNGELQVRYVMSLLTKMIDRDLASFEIRREVHDEYNDRVEAAHDRMIWSHRGMHTWYRNAAGRVTSTMPWRLIDYWRMTREADLSEYHTA